MTCSNLDIKQLDRGQMEFLEDRGFTKGTDLLHCQQAIFNVEFDPRMATLKEVLLDHAGVAAVLPPFDEDISHILGRGQCRSGDGLVLERMRDSQCHGNAARLWELDPNENAIWTGYAMSGDGIWRQHSWVVRESCNQLVETTTPRMLYFGFRLSQRESEQFAYDND